MKFVRTMATMVFKSSDMYNGGYSGNEWRQENKVVAAQATRHQLNDCEHSKNTLMITKLHARLCTTPILGTIICVARSDGLRIVISDGQQIGNGFNID